VQWQAKITSHSDGFLAGLDWASLVTASKNQKGTVNSTIVTITIHFPYSISHCHAHVWRK